MHRFRSHSTINRFRFVAVAVCLTGLFTVLAGSVMIYSLVAGNEKITVFALALAGVAILLVILQWLTASRTRCPLCMTPVLAKKGCAKHRNARKLLGSYRARVALSILYKGHFFCPYCHEPSVMEVRSRT